MNSHLKRFIHGHESMFICIKVVLHELIRQGGGVWIKI